MDYPKADRYGRPIMPNPLTGEEQPWTRATTVAKALDDGDGLINWTGAMVAGGAYARPDLVGQVGARWPMTNENKSEIYSIINDLKDAGGASIGRNAGDTLHEMLKRINLGEKFRPMPPWLDDIKAERELMKRAGITIRPEFVERTVCLPDLGIAGSFDFISEVKGELVISDYKTGNVGGYSWPAFVTQLAIYASATHIFDWNSGEFTPMPPVSRKKAFIVHVPAGLATAVLYEVDIEPGMRAIKAALWVREWRKDAKKLAKKAVLNGMEN